MSDSPEHRIDVPQVAPEVPPIDVIDHQSNRPRARLEGPRFIDTVDDDADLTDIGLRSESCASAESSEPESVEFLLKPLLGRHVVIERVGIAILFGAIVISALTSKAWFFGALLTIFHAVMHFGAARLSLTLGAKFLCVRIGDLRDAWTISLVLAAVAMFGGNIPTPIPGGAGGVLLGALLYAMAFRRFTGRGLRELIVVGMFHLFLALGAFGMLSIYAWARAAVAGG